MPKVFIKDPDAVLDYKFDFAALTNGTGESDWLQSGETISSAVLTVESGITEDSNSLTDTDTSVTVWLSEGVAGSTYTIACKIVTSESRTEERTIYIKVRER